MDARYRPTRRDWLTGLLVGAVTGAAVLGVGGRVAMRGIAIVTGQVPGFSIGGSLTVIFLGLLSGLAGAAVLVGVRSIRLLPPLPRGALYWAFLAVMSFRGLHPVDADKLQLFGPVVVLFGIVLQVGTCRLARRARAHDIARHGAGEPGTATSASTALRTVWGIANALAATAGALAAQTPRRAAAPAPTPAPFSVVEASITDLRTALEQKRTTSREIVLQYLTRVATYDAQLHAVITVNPRALAIADSLDRERAQGRIRGPLHGIPVALKDNIHTTDMRTTGGALAFADLVPPYAATLTKNLEAAGAIILAKTQLTELANWVASGMPGNYNGLNGYGMNPWDPRRDPRDASFDGRPVLGTGGSSSGVGTNVSFWAGNVGTETSGSILSPSNANFLVAIKPTVGRISRYGVIPITADQDTPGPMTRTVTDAAIMLGAMEGAQPDPNDADTKKCLPPAGRDYTKFLNAGALRGARIGVPRAFYYERSAAGANAPRGGLGEVQRRLMDEVLATLRAQGAVIVDPADIPSVRDTVAANNMINWNPCSGLEQARGRDAGCSIAFKYGMKRDFNAWLRSLGDKAPVKTLTELRQWNIAHQRAGAIKYGQAQLDISDEMDLVADRARYEADRRKDVLLSATNGIDAALKANQLDALLFPGVSSAGIGARPGYPTVTVPYGFVPVTGGAGAQAFPAGFEPRPTPFNVSFTGTACSEPRLIELAFAFEQATRKRVAPPLFP